jgi:hypothetical protein
VSANQSVASQQRVVAARQNRRQRGELIRAQPISLPGRLQNSHQNGGLLFLIFVADPTTAR